MSEPTAVTTANSGGCSTDEYVLYVHAETPSERMMRLSNRVADACGRWMEDGESVDALCEVADALAHAASVYAMVEGGANFVSPDVAVALSERSSE